MKGEYYMTDAERLREIADEFTPGAAINMQTFVERIRAIADRLEKREAFTKAAEETSAFLVPHIASVDCWDDATEGDLLIAKQVNAYRAMKEAERPEKACAHEFYSTAFSKGQAYCIHCGKEAERE